jgi:hypothetical protein
MKKSELKKQISNEDRAFMLKVIINSFSECCLQWHSNRVEQLIYKYKQSTDITVEDMREDIKFLDKLYV